MSFEPKKRQFGRVSLGIATLFAALFLPMAGDVAWSAAKHSDGEPNDQPATTYPQVVSTSPAAGAKGVDPSLDAITITFDRAMQKGMSWTGGPPYFPPLVKSAKARWKDERTCLLPVKLEKGKFYRVGINSQSFKNFRAADGVPAPPGAIYFTTQGAAASLERGLAAPKIVSIVPKNGALDVDPSTKVLRVVFDMPMGRGFSWTGGGPDFPTIPAGQQPRWSNDRRNCLLPVKLQPNKNYRLGLNSLSHNNFQSEFGVPLKPVVYEFKTRPLP